MGNWFTTRMGPTLRSILIHDFEAPNMYLHKNLEAS